MVIRLWNKIKKTLKHCVRCAMKQEKNVEQQNINNSAYANKLQEIIKISEKIVNTLARPKERFKSGSGFLPGHKIK